MKVFKRLGLTVKSSLSLTKLRSSDGGYVDPNSFFKNKNKQNLLSLINSILSPLFGDNWKDKQYQDKVDSNLTYRAYSYLKSKINPTKRRYVGDGLIGMWYEFYRLSGGHTFAVVIYDEPTSPPTRAVILNDEDFTAINNL